MFIDVEATHPVSCEGLLLSSIYKVPTYFTAVQLEKSVHHIQYSTQETMEAEGWQFTRRRAMYTSREEHQSVRQWRIRKGFPATTEEYITELITIIPQTWCKSHCLQPSTCVADELKAIDGYDMRVMFRPGSSVLGFNDPLHCTQPCYNQTQQNPHIVRDTVWPDQ